MRITNLARLALPKPLWISLAASLQIDKTLPQAVHDLYGLYQTGKSLRVIINPRRNRGALGKSVTLGHYTCGRISLFPCPRCTTGFLTTIYLHELFHAWLHQYHENLYERVSSCALADEFSDIAFRSLGGDAPTNSKNCWSYKLSITQAMNRLQRFGELATSYRLMESHVVQKRLETAQRRLC